MRINQDGTCGVPGLTETPVNNVDDVLKCIGDTWSLQGEGTMVNAFLMMGNSTPWKINMEPTNHPFRKEHDLPNHYDYVPC